MEINYQTTIPHQ